MNLMKELSSQNHENVQVKMLSRKIQEINELKQMS